MRETAPGHNTVELRSCSRTNKHSKWVCEQDDMFTAGIFFCGTVPKKHAAILSLDSNGGSTKYLYYT